MKESYDTQVYEMDATLRPDRETVAKDIDKMEGGRPVTQYDVLAWMQTRKRMIKKKEERTVCCSVLQCVAVCCSVLQCAV